MLFFIAASSEASALSIAKKNLRDVTSGKKILPLQRGGGVALLRDNGTQKSFALKQRQRFTMQKSRGYESEDEQEPLSVEPFKHVSELEDPFGMEAERPFFSPLSDMEPETQKSHIIYHEAPVSLTKEQQKRFSPKLEKSEALAEEVNYHHIWPIERQYVQRVSSNFGPRVHPVTGEMAFHAGIDIAAKTGTPVLASADGQINATGTHARLGKYVRIDHPDGTYSLYGHLKSTAVKDGQVVLQGEQIGSVGSTGRSTGPHLDYSLRRNSEPMDPMEVLAIPQELRVQQLSALQK